MEIELDQQGNHSEERELMEDFTQEHERNEIISRRVNYFRIMKIYNTIDEFKDEDSTNYQNLKSNHPIIDEGQAAKILVLDSVEFQSQSEYFVYCAWEWKHLKYNDKQRVNVIGKFNKETKFIILGHIKSPQPNFSEINFMVMSPEKVINVTTLSSCDLGKRPRDATPQVTNPELSGIRGNIQHSLFESIMRTNSDDLSDDFIRNLVRHKISENINIIVSKKKGIYDEEKDSKLFFEACKKFISFKKDYVENNTPISNSIENSENEATTTPDVKLKVERIESTERQYESYTYGLVGKIDMVLVCNSIDNSSGENPQNNNFLVPFELKTGIYERFGDEVQIMLYSLILNEEEFEHDNEIGILYYPTLGKQPYVVRLNGMRIFYALHHRNQLVNKFFAVGSLFSCLDGKKTLDQESWMQMIIKIFQKRSSTFSKLISVLGKLSKEKEKIKYLIKWISCVKHEEKKNKRIKFCLKLKNQDELERFIRDLLDSQKVKKQIELDFQWAKPPNNKLLKDLTKILRIDSQITLIHTCEETLTLTGKLNANPSSDGLKVLINRNHFKMNENINEFKEKQKSFNFSNIWKYTRENNFITNCMKNSAINLASNPDFSFLAKSIIHLEPPKENEDEIENVNSDDLQYLEQILNIDQMSAIERALMTDSYSLIQGMPGTGKTQTICYLIDLLMKQGKRVLVTSYQHQAVDNIILRFLEMFNSDEKVKKVMRVYPKSKKDRNPKLKHVEFKLPNQDFSIAKFENLIQNRTIFFSMCLMASNLIALPKNFDYVIVDESSQVIEANLISCLQLGEKFVLVGDHEQLRPIIQSDEARSEGMEISLFERLRKAHPEWVKQLTIQYRMNREIMSIPNALIYDNKLQCPDDDDSIANAKFVMDKSKWSLEFESDWMRDIIKVDSSVLFINLDSYRSFNFFPYERKRQIEKNKKIMNFCVFMINKFFEYKKKSERDSVNEKPTLLCPFNDEIDAVKDVIEEKIEVMTINKSQGIDRDFVVVACLTRPQLERNLLNDMRLVNVACTRAKRKLILVGSQKELKKLRTMTKLLEILKEKKWIYELSS